MWHASSHALFKEEHFVLIISAKWIGEQVAEVATSDADPDEARRMESSAGGRTSGEKRGGADASVRMEGILES